MLGIKRIREARSVEKGVVMELQKAKAMAEELKGLLSPGFRVTICSAIFTS